MLGPSIIGAVTPFAFGYSLFARTRGSNRPLNYTALALTAFELLVVIVTLGMGIFQALAASAH
jgi:hypothetical protein